MSHLGDCVLADDFHLSKWYVDCVSPAGDVFIGYSARLLWRGAALTFASTLVRANGRDALSRTSLRRSPAPLVEGSEIRWRHGALAVEGVWRSRGKPCRQLVYSSPEGRITWHGLQPRSCASVSAAGTPIAGWGYAEHLEMTVRPWRLPLDVLRWGRFTGESGSVVWIDWQGPEPRTFVFTDGERIADAVVDDTGVGMPGRRLVLDAEGRAVLRDGTLGTTALAEAPRVARLLPGWILGVRECKWLSRAALTEDGETTDAGWAIHEVVRFARAGGNP
jgi:hypothetical protein